MSELNPEFIKGAWFAYDEVLGWINSCPHQFINKKELYKHVMELRPRSLVSKSMEDK